MSNYGEATAYTFRDFGISEHMMGAIRRYIEQRIAPGSFLEAVICNDLQLAVGHADETNLHNLPAFVGYFYNEAPMHCWGSKEKYKEWLGSRPNEA